MSKSDEYLKAFLEIVEEASKSAKEKDDLGLKLLDAVGEKFDDYVVNKHFEAHQQKISLKRILKAIISLPRTLDYGPVPKSKVKQFIDYLELNNLLKRSQIRLLNIYQMLRFEEDGSCKILMPSRFAFKKAKVIFAATSLISVIAGFYVWQNAEILNKNFMVIYTIGTLLGYFFRGAYDIAWGRENLVIYLKDKYPWFILDEVGHIK